MESEKEDLKLKWIQNYRELDDYHQKALNTSWKDLKESLKECERDWAKPSDLRKVVDNQKNRFKSAYDGFVDTYEPNKSGSAIALYQMNMDNLDTYEIALGLDQPGTEILNFRR